MSSKKIIEDLLRSASTAAQPRQEHVSPEGVEERVLLRYDFFVTQTQGGKYRVYLGAGRAAPQSLGVYGNVTIAALMLAQAMLHSALLLTSSFGPTKKNGGES